MLRIFSRRLGISSADLSPEKKNLLWRAKQRGLLELDIILGSFADKNLISMTPKETDEFAKILAFESPDLYKLINGQVKEFPQDLQENSVFRNLLKHVNPKHPSL